MYKKYVWLKSKIKKFIPKAIFKHLVNYFHFLEALYANIVNGWPAKTMIFIGVTGTNGKTSTSYMIAKILQGAGYKVGLNSTAVTIIGKEESRNNQDGGRTTANPIVLQKLLAKMKKDGVTHVVMEAASQAMVQHRLWGIKFSSSAFTNLTSDHLDYHQTMQKYAKAKAILFKNTLNHTILNGDDEWSEYFRDSTRAKDVTTYGQNHSIDYKIEKIQNRKDGTDFSSTVNGVSYAVSMKLYGNFNVYNAVAAIATCIAEGVDIKTAISAIEAIENIPGRMNAVEAGQNFKVIIDYAHTPDAVENILKTCRDITAGKLICITGASGDKAVSRRGPVGKIAASLSNVLIVTDDEPGSEDPTIIRSQVLSGANEAVSNAKIIEIPDREEAIKKAISIARKDDTVVILGIGHQNYREFKEGKRPWDEKAVVLKYVK